MASSSKLGGTRTSVTARGELTVLVMFAPVVIRLYEEQLKTSR
jgi:hypothetical protein